LIGIWLTEISRTFPELILLGGGALSHLLSLTGRAILRRALGASVPSAVGFAIQGPWGAAVASRVEAEVFGFTCLRLVLCLPIIHIEIIINVTGVI